MTIWTENQFPAAHVVSRFPGTKRRMAKPFCWTPTKAFNFGGRHYIALYPCIAFETKNFGFIVQKLWHKTILGNE